MYASRVGKTIIASVFICVSIILTRTATYCYGVAKDPHGACLNIKMDELNLKKKYVYIVDDNGMAKRKKQQESESAK
jgi:hypothetical protein